MIFNLGFISIAQSLLLLLITTPTYTFLADWNFHCWLSAKNSIIMKKNAARENAKSGRPIALFS
jgi:hypothetical protein